MRKFLSSILFVFTLWSVQATNIVVDVRGNVSENDLKKVFSSKLVSAITKTNEFSAIERNESFRDAIEDEYHIQSSGDVLENQIFQMGKRYGAKYIAVVELTEIFGEIFASSHLIDAETTKVLWAYDASSPVNNMSQLTDLANNIAQGLILNPIHEKNEQMEREALIEQQNYENLRQKAISNLIPVGATMVGKYVIMLCEIEFNPNFKSGPSYPPTIYVTIKDWPKGFKLADYSIIEYLYKSGLSIDNGGGEKIKFILDLNFKRKYEYQSSVEYRLPYVIYNGRTLYKGSSIVMSAWYDKKKKHYNISTYPGGSSDYGAIMYKDAPTESEIELEMIRIEMEGR